MSGTPAKQINKRPEPVGSVNPTKVMRQSKAHVMPHIPEALIPSPPPPTSLAERDILLEILRASLSKLDKLTLDLQHANEMTAVLEQKVTQLTAAYDAAFNAQLTAECRECGANDGCTPTSSPLMALAGCSHFVCWNFLQNQIFSMRTHISASSRRQPFTVTCPICRTCSEPRVVPALLPYTPVVDEDSLHVPRSGEHEEILRLIQLNKADLNSFSEGQRLVEKCEHELMNYDVRHLLLEGVAPVGDPIGNRRF